MQSSPARKKGIRAKKLFGSFCQPFARPSTPLPPLHPLCPAHWGRLRCVFANDDAGADIRLAALAALSWPRLSWRSLMGLPHFTNWLNCKFMRCPVGLPPSTFPLHSPPLLAPSPPQAISPLLLKLIPPYVTRTTPARYPFWLRPHGVRFVFIFIFLVSFSFSLSFILFLLYLPPPPLFSHCPLLWVSWKKLYYTSITTPGHDNKWVLLGALLVARSSVSLSHSHLPLPPPPPLSVSPFHSLRLLSMCDKWCVFCCGQRPCLSPAP